MLGTLPAHHLADLCASLVNASFIEKLQVLDAVDLSERLKKSLPLLVRQIEGLEMVRRSPNNRTEKHYTLQPKNRVMIIRPQRDTISRSGHELVPSDDEGDELQELQQKLRYSLLPHLCCVSQHPVLTDRANILETINFATRSSSVDCSWHF